jgi:hypothetical protein
VDSFRRNLQRSYIDQMSRVVLNRSPSPWWTPVPEDARSLARYNFSQLSEKLGAALKGGNGLNVETKAHLAESKARIDAVLNADLVVTPR